jgi:hypothetical protein
MEHKRIMEFFPPNAFDDRPSLHTFSDRWYVPHLLAMKEQPLYPPVPDQPVLYRLLFLPTFEQPSLVRLTEAVGIWRAVCKRTDGQGGYSPGRLVGEAERELSRADAKRFTRLLDRVAFWEMRSFEDSAGADGSQAVLEGVKAGKYHVVDRWSPRNTPYAELVDFLLNLCRGVAEVPPEPRKYVSSFAELEERLRPGSSDDGPV